MSQPAAPRRRWPARSAAPALGAAGFDRAAAAGTLDGLMACGFAWAAFHPDTEILAER